MLLLLSQDTFTITKLLRLAGWLLLLPSGID
jgi:hypothetical protein